MSDPSEAWRDAPGAAGWVGPTGFEGLTDEAVRAWEYDGRVVADGESYFSAAESAEITRRFFLRTAAEKQALVNWKAWLAGEEGGGGTPWWKALVAWSEEGGEGELDLLGSLEKLPRHDATGAAALVDRVGPQVLSVPDVRDGRLFRVWSGMVWAEDSGEVRVWTWIDQLWVAYRRALLQMTMAAEEAAEKAAAAKRTAGGGEAEVEKTRGSHLKIWVDRMKKHGAYFDRLGNQQGRTAMAELLAHVPGRCVKDMDFDADPEHVVVRNGVLDLGVVVERVRGGEGVGGWTGWGADSLLEHSSARAVTMSAEGVEYVPEIGCGEVWARYLETSLPNERVRWHLQKAAGVALLGRPADKMMLNLIGPPDSGKSVVLEVLDEVLGDYAVSVSAETFLQPRFSRGADAPNPSLHLCRRAKLVLCSEPDASMAWNSGQLKSLTGRDKQTTRGLREHPQTWTPRFMLIVASNSFVRLDVSDEALVGRIHPIEFPRSFRKPGPGQRWEEIPEEDRADLGLTRRILDSEWERSAVLNWLLIGLEGYLREGLEAPAEIGAARAGMVREMSPAREFIDEMLETGVYARDTGEPLMNAVGCEEAYMQFVAWQAQQGEPDRFIKGPRIFNKAVGVAGMTNPTKRKRRGKDFRGRTNEYVFDRLMPGVNWPGER